MKARGGFSGTHHKEEEERRLELFIPGAGRTPKGITRAVLLRGTELPTAGRPTGARTRGKEEEGGGRENRRGKRRAQPFSGRRGPQMGRKRGRRALKGLPQPEANARPRRESWAARTRRPEVKQDGYGTFRKSHCENACSMRCSKIGRLQKAAPEGTQ